jgi:predicted ester cyclase
MNKSEKNKQFYLRYAAALSGKDKPLELLKSYIEDEDLIEHILFFEKLFPKYELVIDELMAEGDRIFVRSHFIGKHEGMADGIPATNKTVDTPFALGYKIKNEKIVDFWAIANEMELFEQMGLTKEQLNIKPK